MCVPPFVNLQSQWQAKFPQPTLLSSSSLSLSLSLSGIGGHAINGRPFPAPGGSMPWTIHDTRSCIYTRRRVISFSVKIRFPCLLPRVTRNTRHAKRATCCCAAAVSRICFRSGGGRRRKEEGEKEMERARRKEGEGEGEKMGYKSGREWETKLRYTSDLNRI